MTAPTANLFTRDDTFFGVCEGLGQELGVNPLWFRLAFALPVYFFPLAVIGTYLGLGLVLAAVRRFRPDVTEVVTLAATPADDRADREQPLPLAA